MFKIYDLNMKEIPFPDGVMPLEIFVGSISKERVTEAVDGRSGVVDYGFNYTDRPVSLFLRIKAKDKIDFRLLRNEVFATFDVGNSFYVAESDVPSRVLKVVVDESYIPDRLTEEYADFDINCRTLDSVFWESIYTTLELHDSGYYATAEKYGLVDNIDDEKVQYRFEPEKLTVELSSSDFEQGTILSGNGNNSSNPNEIRSKGYFSTFPGSNYTFEDKINGDNINYWWIFEYDSDGQYIGFSNTPLNGNGRITFTARGSRVRIRSVSHTSLSPSDVGTQTQPTLTGPASLSTFTVYNAGNVTIEPESMMLDIIIYRVTTSGGFTIRNKTTGDEFVFNGEINNLSLILRGMNVLVSSVYNRFRDTNRRFISLAPGDNEFEITGGTFDEATFEFKYFYK